MCFVRPLKQKDAADSKLGVAALIVPTPTEQNEPQAPKNTCTSQPSYLDLYTKAMQKRVISFAHRRHKF